MKYIVIQGNQSKELIYLRLLLEICLLFADGDSKLCFLYMNHNLMVFHW